MRRAFIVVAACAIFVAAPKAQQATGELAIAPGVVDVRGMLKEDGTLDRLKARARGSIQIRCDCLERSRTCRLTSVRLTLLGKPQFSRE
jgi:hypothetical protein